MGITFVPDAGDVLICKFAGFQQPEMTKVRPVIVLSPRSRKNFPGTYLVIPTSRTPPSPPEAWHHEFKLRSHWIFRSYPTGLGNVQHGNVCGRYST